MDWLSTDLIELVLSILGLASIVARFTPTTADNKLVDAALRLVHGLGLTKPK